MRRWLWLLLLHIEALGGSPWRLMQFDLREAGVDMTIEEIIRASRAIDAGR